MLRVAFLIALSWLLSACAFVDVHTQYPDESHLSAWPLGVRVELAPDKASDVTADVAGFASGCNIQSAGLISMHCTVVNPNGCPVALIGGATATQKASIKKAARQTPVDCAQTKETTR